MPSERPPLSDAYAAACRGDVEQAEQALNAGAALSSELMWLTRAHISLAKGGVPNRPPSGVVGRAALSAARWAVALWGEPLPSVGRLGEHERVVFDGWRALLEGGGGGRVADVDRAKEAFRKLGEAEHLVDATVLSALLSADEGDLSTALRSARTAARMARTEAMPQLEYVAGITLARVRRLCGSPAHAVLILRAVRDVAASAYRPWIDWELALAGGPPGLAEDGLASQLRRFVAEGTTMPTGVPAFVRGDADAVAELLSLEDGGRFLHRRVFGPGLGTVALLLRPQRAVKTVAERALDPLDVEWPCRKDTGKRRAAKLVSVLADGEVREEAACFADIYGFDMVRDLHRGTFDVLIHRARKQLEGLASLEREGRSLRLVVEAPFAVADPASASRSRDRILQAVAAGAETASDAAKQTGLSLRQAQTVLRELIESGECRAKKVGRRLQYRVEDTVFRSATRTDLSLG